MQEITNFARFYGVFNKVKCPGDREELKCDLVRQATGGRTESLREVTRREYDELCASLESTVPGSRLRRPVYDEQRRWRSSVLHQMQKMGIDTSDWGRVNAFCQDARIAGKVFRELDTLELEALFRKLLSIERKGGLREPGGSQGPVAEVVSIR